MSAKTHGQWYAGEKKYLAFEVEDSVYAISIEQVKDIVATEAGTPYELMPQAPVYVKCVIKLEERVLTVIELGKTSDDILKERNQIIVLNYADRDIGILVHNIHLIDVSTSELFVDELIKGQKFVYDEEGKIYLVFDISQYDIDVDI